MRDRMHTISASAAERVAVCKRPSMDSLSTHSLPMVAPELPKPQQRQLEIVKAPNTRFGIDLCRVNGRVFILKVHSPTDSSNNDRPTAALSHAAHRVGLQRFDELLQVEEEFIQSRSLESIYRYLHRAELVNITVQDRPLINTQLLTVSSAYVALQSQSLVMLGDAELQVVCVMPDSPASVVLPVGESIVEVDGRVTLGMSVQEVLAVLEYARHTSEDGFIEVSTMPRDLARAFFAAFKLTADVYGHTDWKPVDHLRKSLRHSRRNSRTVSTQKDVNFPAPTLKNQSSLTSKSVLFSSSSPLRSLSSLFSLGSGGSTSNGQRVKAE